VAKAPKPWYCKATDSWYVCRHGKQIPLCKGKANRTDNARAHGYKALPGQTDQNQRLLATASPVFHGLHRVLGS
jgi:hypothetical protein